jgi:hypothetical protein
MDDINLDDLLTNIESDKGLWEITVNKSGGARLDMWTENSDAPVHTFTLSKVLFKDLKTLFSNLALHDVGL